MGGSSSKPAPLLPPVPQIARADLSQAQSATFAPGYLESLARQNEEIASAANKAANDAAAQAAAALASVSRWKIIGWSFGILIGITILVVFGILIYDLWARNNSTQTIFLPGLSKFTNYTEGLANQQCYGTPIDLTSGKFLDPEEVLKLFQDLAAGCGGGEKSLMACVAKKIGTTQSLEDAQTACSNNPKCTGIIYWSGRGIHPEWDGQINSVVEDNFGALKGYTPYTGSPTITSIKTYQGPGGFAQAGSQLPPAGTLTFTPVETCPPPATPPPPSATASAPASGGASASSTAPLNLTTGPAPYNSSTSAPSKSSIPTPPGPTGPDISTLSTGTAPPPPLLYQWWVGAGNMPGSANAQTTSIIPTTGAPLSSGNQGAYGIQWWMFIQDWNYGYGQEKPVLIRADSSSSAVMNPKVTLHPTDNVLRVAVSVFPTDASGGVSEPVAANAPETAEDTFTCEVPNIPLQSWFSVSLTVFGRNLDIYLNGMLVKSCFMSGVPKPAAGDIQITPNGGFSGQVCGLQSSSKMLNPSDALGFYSASNSCVSSVPGAPTDLANTTGYSVKFGVYDTVGREIRQYTF